jgi:hypothetical protein
MNVHSNPDSGTQSAAISEASGIATLTSSAAAETKTLRGAYEKTGSLTYHARDTDHL